MSFICAIAVLWQLAVECSDRRSSSSLCANRASLYRTESARSTSRAIVPRMRISPFMHCVFEIPLNFYTIVCLSLFTTSLQVVSDLLVLLLVAAFDCCVSGAPPI